MLNDVIDKPSSGGCEFREGEAIDLTGGMDSVEYVRRGRGHEPTGITSQHRTDAEGRSAGGMTSGKGLLICWQDGPLGRGEDRREPNGAFVCDVIDAVIDRLNHYQRGRYANPFNLQAIHDLNNAKHNLALRTAEREARQVEGTHAV